MAEKSWGFPTAPSRTNWRVVYRVTQKLTLSMPETQEQILDRAVRIKELPLLQLRYRFGKEDGWIHEGTGSESLLTAIRVAQNDDTHIFVYDQNGDLLTVMEIPEGEFNANQFVGIIYDAILRALDVKYGPPQQ